MPIRNHFLRPERRMWNWKSVYLTWSVTIAELLNADRVLPACFTAQPMLDFGGQALPDIPLIVLQNQALQSEDANGAVATAVWSPPKPKVSVACDIADLDSIEIKVFNEEEGHTLVAAVELVSPANKDRPETRKAFAAKCSAYLQQEVSVVIVDIVTDRHESLHDELMEMLGLGDDPAVGFDTPLYAISYRAVGKVKTPRLEMWPESLRVGSPLPVLPLWIAPAQAVPLDLEASYSLARKKMKMPKMNE